MTTEQPSVDAPAPVKPVKPADPPAATAESTDSPVTAGPTDSSIRAASTDDATAPLAATTDDDATSPPGATADETSSPAATTDDATSPPAATAAEATAAAAEPGTTVNDTERARLPTPPTAAVGPRTLLPTERPPGVPPDPWTAFASMRERGPGRGRRAVRSAGRGLIHEYTLAVLGGLALAVVLTWPTLRYPAHTVPGELGDPSRQAWQIGWAGHILRTDPARLWQSNAYFPQRYSFAWGDSLLGYAPAGLLGDGPIAATLRYTILFVLAHALLAIGGYALVRQLGAGRTGAAVAAGAFAYAPWWLAQDGHLDIVSAGGIPLALAMLARGHGWTLRHGLRRPRARVGWVAAGWLVAAWQLSLGFSLGLPFAYVLGGVILVLLVGVPIRRMRTGTDVYGWRIHVTDLAGVVIVAAVGALVAIPYFKVAGSQPAAAEIDSFSPPLRALLIGPASSLIWGAPHAAARQSLSSPAEMTLLPGFVLYALALVGLLFSVWTVRQRLFLLAGVVVAAIFTLGDTFFGGRVTYLPLFGHLPGSLGVRVPGRLMLWVTLLLAVLAAGAVAEFVRRAEQWSALRMPPFPGPWLRLATLVPLLLVLVEGLNATPHPVVPGQPAALRTVTGPLLVLPTAAGSDQTVQLWSTSTFPKMTNGGGDFAAAQRSNLRQKVVTFPDTASVQYLRGLGVTTVVLLKDRARGTPWERSGDVPVDMLGIRRDDVDNDTVLFQLS